jgi:hypothetical protein
VLRDGYEAPDGVQCLQGDEIRLPDDIARRAAQNGALDIIAGA